MHEINSDMYSQITSPKLGLGWFSKSWVKFNSGKYSGQNVLIKVPLSDRPAKQYFVFSKNPDLKFQQDEINALLAEIICKKGDPTGECAEYFLAIEDGKKYICTPSFIGADEELISGKDLVPTVHQKLSRVNPKDALIVSRDLKLDLLRRRIPKLEAENCEQQFLKDAFKLAYLGMFDPNHSNWGILYKGIGKARYAPMFDLDFGLNIPFEYGENIAAERKKITSDYMEELLSGNYLKNYIEVLSNANPWFNDFLVNFYNGVKDLDIRKELLEQKGIDIDESTLQHYANFLNIQNTVIKDYVLTQSREQNVLNRSDENITDGDNIDR